MWLGRRGRLASSYAALYYLSMTTKSPECPDSYPSDRLPSHLLLRQEPDEEEDEEEDDGKEKEDDDDDDAADGYSE